MDDEGKQTCFDFSYLGTLQGIIIGIKQNHDDKNDLYETGIALIS